MTVRRELLFGNHFLRLPCGLLPILNYHARKEKAGAAGRERGWDRRGNAAVIGDGSLLVYFKMM